jgi:nucleotide-binding universal stress UspA family protein
MFKNILIVIDLGYIPMAKKLAETALEMTKNNPDTIYRVAGIVSAPSNSIVSSFLPRNFDKDVLAEANKKLHEFTAGIFPKESKIQHIVAYGTIYEEVNRVAEEKNVDLIIMMASKDDNKDGLSSNTVKVARYSRKPILILR